MAYISETKSGTFQVRYENTGRKYKSKTFPTYDQAKEFCSSLDEQPKKTGTSNTSGMIGIGVVERKGRLSLTVSYRDASGERRVTKVSITQHGYSAALSKALALRNESHLFDEYLQVLMNKYPYIACEK